MKDDMRSQRSIVAKMVIRFLITALLIAAVFSFIGASGYGAWLAANALGIPSYFCIGAALIVMLSLGGGCGAALAAWDHQ